MLRTKTDLFKAHNSYFDNGILLFFKKAVKVTADSTPVISLNLEVCHVRVSKKRYVKDDQGLDKVLYALQADFEANCTQVMYFKTESSQ